MLLCRLWAMIPKNHLWCYTHPTSWLLLIESINFFQLRASEKYDKNTEIQYFRCHRSMLVPDEGLRRPQPTVPTCNIKSILVILEIHSQFSTQLFINNRFVLDLMINFRHFLEKNQLKLSPVWPECSMSYFCPVHDMPIIIYPKHSSIFLCFN